MTSKAVTLKAQSNNPVPNVLDPYSGVQVAPLQRAIAHYQNKLRSTKVEIDCYSLFSHWLIPYKM